MKNTFSFIKWQFNKLGRFGKLSLFALSSIVMSLVTIHYDAVSDVFLFFGAIGAVAMISAVTYDIFKTQYAEFKKERQQLFETIKYSDKQESKDSTA